MKHEIISNFWQLACICNQHGSVFSVFWIFKIAITYGNT